MRFRSTRERSFCVCASQITALSTNYLDSWQSKQFFVYPKNPSGGARSLMCQTFLWVLFAYCLFLCSVFYVACAVRKNVISCVEKVFFCILGWKQCSAQTGNAQKHLFKKWKSQTHVIGVLGNREFVGVVTVVTYGLLFQLWVEPPICLIYFKYRVYCPGNKPNKG